MRQSGKVFSLYKNSEEICDIGEGILQSRKNILIKKLQEEGYVIDEIKKRGPSGNHFIAKYLININTKDGLEEIGFIIDDEIITRDFKNLDKFLTNYTQK